MCRRLFLSRLADNKILAAGAGSLAEPLGKLTALQQLDFRSTLACVLQGIDCAFAHDGAMLCVASCS